MEYVIYKNEGKKMNFNLIYEILKNPDKENLRIEYKQFGILDNNFLLKTKQVI